MAKRLALSVGFGGTPEQNKELIKRVQVAEEAGVEAVFTAETWGRDQFSLLTQLALATSKIKIGTGIAPVYGRSPGVLAMTAATLDELSGGRVVLGLGTSGARVIEHWHGQPFEKPIQRTKEYIEIINMMVSGEKVFYDGEIFKLQRGFKLLFEPVRKHIPIFVASISPKSMASVGQVADGWMPIYWPKSKFVAGKEMVARASVQAGRPADAVECVASLTVVLNPDPVKAKMQAAGPISWYVTNMGDFYHQMLTRNGFGEEVAAMRKVAEEHRPPPFGTNPELMAAMGDRMLDETAIYGDLETVAAGIEERRQLGVDLPTISMPGGDLKQLETVLGTLVS
ncbi:MAG TPA: LLM class flavin-dependent oxidoreductase [Tepidiformaceae bacterium]|jgi:alkanesulfonate monooxygenase SsuD/methylene tetrahydromethanopterin reductase-like flavin-dependent oxidoreductase (luciferase family)|nr:LLM class flavin-dependent oxidoreductase [Tepidiformaceae bacterium]